MAMACLYKSFVSLHVNVFVIKRHDRHILAVRQVMFCSSLDLCRVGACLSCDVSREINLREHRNCK